MGAVHAQQRQQHEASSHQQQDRRKSQGNPKSINGRDVAKGLRYPTTERRDEQQRREGNGRRGASWMLVGVRTAFDQLCGHVDGGDGRTEQCDQQPQRGLRVRVWTRPPGPNVNMNHPAPPQERQRHCHLHHRTLEQQSGFSRGGH